MPAMSAGGLCDAQGFLVLVEDLLADEPDESVDPALQEIGARVVPNLPESGHSRQQYRGVYNTGATSS
jgi:hypothetical protein